MDARYASSQSLAQTAISGAEFSAALRAIAARKLVVILDCCHAGGIGQPKDASSAPDIGLSEAYLDTLKGGRGRVILASSRSNELSWILPGASHSLFTSHLLAGLRGGANGAGAQAQTRHVNVEKRELPTLQKSWQLPEELTCDSYY